MANIIQAARWMREGKEVIRTAPEEEGYRYRIDEGGFVVRFARITRRWVCKNVFAVEDLLANDWEIHNG